MTRGGVSLSVDDPWGVFEYGIVGKTMHGRGVVRDPHANRSQPRARGPPSLESPVVTVVRVAESKFWKLCR